MSQPDISSLRQLIAKAEDRVASRQNDLAMAAAALSAVVGPLAAAHRLAELALEMAELAEQEGEQQ